MFGIKRRTFLKGVPASFTLLTGSFTLFSSKTANSMNMSSSVSPRELPGFEGQLPVALSVSDDGTILGISKDSTVGVLDRDGDILAGKEQAVFWRPDLTFGKLPTPLNTTEQQMSQVFGASSQGIACGVFQSKQGALQAAVWENGLIEILSGLKGKERSRALGCNDLKVVVGSATQNNLDQPVYWDANTSKKAKRLPLPNGFSGRASGINNDGIVVGELTSKDGSGQAAIWLNTQEQPHVLKTPETVVSSYASGVTSNGTVFGAARGKQDTFRAVYWQGGVMHYINGLGNTFSTVMAVSEGGIAVGTYITGNKEIRLFAFKEGRITELRGLGGAQKSVLSINNSGVACGMSQNNEGQARAVLWEIGNL